MINRAGLKAAIEWKKTTDPEQIKDSTLLCPKDLSPSQKHAALEATRPEFFGRIARIIDSSLTASFDSLASRGELGLINWKNEPISADVIKNMSDLANAMQVTIGVDMQKTVESMRTPDENGDIYDFEEYLAINALARNRTALRGYGRDDALSSLEAGTRTATAHIALLIPPMREVVGDSSNVAEILSNSHQPLKRLARLNLDHLIIFQDYLVKHRDTLGDLFTHIDGKVDFKDSLYDLEMHGAKLSDTPAEYSPTLGCPILFNSDQTQKLWRWGVVIADKSGLL